MSNEKLPEQKVDNKKH